MGESVKWLLVEVKWLLACCGGLFKREIPKSETGQDEVVADKW